MFGFTRAFGKPACREHHRCTCIESSHWDEYDHPSCHPFLQEEPVSDLPFWDNSAAQLQSRSQERSLQLSSTTLPFWDNFVAQSEWRAAESRKRTIEPAETVPSSPAMKAMKSMTGVTAVTKTGPTGTYESIKEPLEIGETTEVQGSAEEPYIVKRVAPKPGLPINYSCTCPDMRYRGFANKKFCKHIVGLRDSAASAGSSSQVCHPIPRPTPLVFIATSTIGTQKTRYCTSRILQAI